MKTKVAIGTLAATLLIALVVAYGWYALRALQRAEWEQRAVTWDLGELDLGTTVPHAFSFVFEPHVRSPDVVTIELQNSGWDEYTMPLIEFTVSLLDEGGAILTHPGDSREKCNWHSPHLGVVAATLDTARLYSGRKYTLVFTMRRPAKVRDGTKALLRASFRADWRHTDPSPASGQGESS